VDIDVASDSDKEGILQRKNDLDEGGRKVHDMQSLYNLHLYINICTYYMRMHYKN